MSILIPPNGWGAEASPFHAAELAAQQRAGVSSKAELGARRGIRRYMPDQHRQFFAEQPFMVFGGVDANGQPWATLRAGAPGFVSSPDARTLRIDGGVLPGDPLAGGWQKGAMIGGLGLHPQTRRRNRVNGVVKSVEGETMTLEVSQSFGNCAKYIQSRTPTFVEHGAALPSMSAEVATQLSDADRALLASADTFFIASANLAEEAGLARGVDVSHRGGAPGFVRIDDANTLTTPDYSGNHFFNTIGNLIHEPRAGLLFIDFVTGDLVYLAVRAEIVWDGVELAAFEGAQRLVRFHVQEVRRSRGALPFRWSDVELAPQFASAGRGSAVSEAAGASSWQKLRVTAVVDAEDSERRAVSISASIGITPMMAMLNHSLDAPHRNRARAKRLLRSIHSLDVEVAGGFIHPVRLQVVPAGRYGGGTKEPGDNRSGARRGRVSTLTEKASVARKRVRAPDERVRCRKCDGAWLTFPVDSWSDLFAAPLEIWRSRRQGDRQILFHPADPHDHAV